MEVCIFYARAGSRVCIYADENVGRAHTQAPLVGTKSFANEREILAAGQQTGGSNNPATVIYVTALYVRLRECALAHTYTHVHVYRRS